MRVAQAQRESNGHERSKHSALTGRAWLLGLLTLASACRAGDPFDPSEVPKGAALVVSSGSRVDGDGRRWDLNRRADSESLLAWMRVWSGSHAGETFILWMPGETPTAEVMRFFSLLDAAGIEDWKIWKGREVR